MLRRLLFALLALFALMLAAVLLAPALLNEQALARIATEQIRERTGAELTVNGEIGLSLFPRFALALREVQLAVPEQQLTLQAGELRTGVALLPLLRRTVEIDTISARDITIRTTVSEAAATSAASTAGMDRARLDAYYAARRAARSATVDGAAALALPLALDVGALRIENARLLSVDSRGEVVSELLLESLTADGVNTAGEAVPLTLSLRIPGTGQTAEVHVAGEGSIVTDLAASELRLQPLSLRVSGATAAPLLARLSGGARLDRGTAELQLVFDLDDSHGEGTLRYAAASSPQISAVLDMNRLNPALLVLAGPEGAAAAGRSAGEERSAEAGSATPLPWDLLRSLDTEASLSIGAVMLDAHELRDVRAQLRAREGTIELSEVSGSVHQGNIAFNAVFDARYAPATLRTQGGVNGLQLDSAAQAMALPLALSGAADLNWELASSGSTGEELIAALRGPITLRTAGVGLRGISLEEKLCSAVALVNQEELSATFPADTTFESLEADISLGDGIARLDPLSARLPAVVFTGKGELTLLQQDLRASFRAQLQEGLEALDPACRVNERLTSLRWPVECEGNLQDDPASWCELNSDQILRDLLEQEARRKLEDGAGRLLKKLIPQL